MTEMKVRRHTVDEGIVRLVTYIERMERRYEISSEEMSEFVKSGRYKDTAEIATWLIKYRQLQELKAIKARGRTTGTPTKTT
jgi:hypothetical protein